LGASVSFFTTFLAIREPPSWSPAWPPDPKLRAALLCDPLSLLNHRREEDLPWKTAVAYFTPAALALSMNFSLG
jgi:hypothetical protein